MYRLGIGFEDIAPDNRIKMKDLRADILISSQILSIEWERIIFKIKIKLHFKEGYTPKKKLDFYLVTHYFRSNAKFKVEEEKDGVYELSLNITNPGYCSCLPKAAYSIFICEGDKILSEPKVLPEVAKELMDKSRSFFHSNKSRAYNVELSIKEDLDELYLLFRVLNAKDAGVKLFTAEDPNLSLVEPFSVLKTMGKRIGKIIPKKLKFSKNRLVRGTYKFLSAHNLKKKKARKTILFMSEQRYQIGANLQSVHDRLIERGLDKDFEILVSARDSVSDKGKLGKKSWIEFVKKLAKADIVFIDDHVPVFDWLLLRPEVKLIQLWHAGAGFKSSGYSRWGNTGCPATMSCHRQYDFGIAGSSKIGIFFSEVFGINDSQILPTGMPRMDEYLDETYRKKTVERLYSDYPYLKGKKVILFAPTYRGKNNADAMYPYELIDFERLYQFCKDEYVVLFKMHPWVVAPVPIEEKHNDRFFDFNTFPNINDLFYITDLLITDYSSNIFEYSLMRKPMLFFAFDKIQYSYSRGFHRDYEESTPGKIVETFDELMEALEKKDFQFEKVEEYVEEHFDYIDSHASDRVIDWFVLEQMPDKFKEKIRLQDEENERVKRLDFSVLRPEE